MDIRMPRLDGIAATARLRAMPTPPEVLVLTTFQADAYVLDALRAGASGFLLKDTPPTEILAAIRQVAGGGTIVVAIGRTNRDRPHRAIGRRRASSIGGGCAGPGEQTRTRGRGRDRPGPVERGDRGRAVPQRGDREGTRVPTTDQARPEQPSSDRHARARRGPSLTGRQTFPGRAPERLDRRACKSTVSDVPSR